MTLKRWRSSWCALVAVNSLLWAVASPLGAQETICDPEQPSHCSRPILKDDVAPFSGQLLSTELSIDLGLKAMYCDERLKLELNFQKKSLDLDLALEKRLRENDRKAWEAKEALLLERLEEAQGVSWYEHPAFVATVSVICTVLVFWGARETLKALD